MAYWDKETELGTVPKNKIEKQKISYTELKNKQYISITNLKLLKDEDNKDIWKPIGGTSIVISEELKTIWPQLTNIIMAEKEEIKEQE